MKKTAAYSLLLLGFVIFMTGCSLFRKAGKGISESLPPPREKKPVPQEKPHKNPVARAPFNVPAFAREVRKPLYRVALFSPLYLDRVTADSGFAGGKAVPRYALPGLEFYEGALIAMDSLRQRGLNLQLHLYDTKSLRPSMQQVLQGQLDSTDLIIGSVNADEFQRLAGFALKREINFISATYPNDGAITENPFLTIINSTLRTHCYAIQDFAQQKFSNQQILVLHRNTAQEKQNMSYIRDAWQQMKFGRKVPVKSMDWDDSTSTGQLAAMLSAEKNNVVIVTALYVDEAETILQKLAELTGKYTINVIGMPTLAAQRELLKPVYKGLSIYYSTPYADIRNDALSRDFMLRFFEQYHARPSDMAFKGFETFLYFGSRLQEDGLYFNPEMNGNAGRFATEYNFQPVYREKEAASDEQVPDYFENKHLYFIRIRDGVISRAN
ncbi:hypothetical protein [Compostibacter hankyongensis]|uniref:Amino acid ABC transporter substrate-binding protein n=1 Tax=Compostibacter hankyongensis TaxID=1007089 RepID=A0ABP8FHY6_9BACT